MSRLTLDSRMLGFRAWSLHTAVLGLRVSNTHKIGRNCDEIYRQSAICTSLSGSEPGGGFNDPSAAREIINWWVHLEKICLHQNFTYGKFRYPIFSLILTGADCIYLKMTGKTIKTPNNRTVENFMLNGFQDKSVL